MKGVGRVKLLGLLLSLMALPATVAAHSPSVIDDQHPSPDTAVILDDPTLSRAIGATIAAPGEVDWFRMDLHAGDPIVVGMTAPDAVGSLAATFLLLGPGLPDPEQAGQHAVELAAMTGAAGALPFQPVAAPIREVHAGLGFLDYGDVSLTAPADGTYWIAVFAVDRAATGKYVLAPGIRERFGADAVEGMADLIAFFAAPWPPASRAAPGMLASSSASFPPPSMAP